MTADQRRIGAIVAAGVVVLGVFLPWMKASGFGQSLEVTGFDGDTGKAVLAAAVVAIVFLLALRGEIRDILAAVVGVGLLVYSLYKYADVTHTIDTKIPHTFSASVGLGLYLCIIGSALLAVFAIWNVVAGYQKPAEVLEPEARDETAAPNGGRGVV